MPAKTSMLHIWVEESTKTQVTETLASTGLSVFDALRLFLSRVVAAQASPRWRNRAR